MRVRFLFVMLLLLPLAGQAADARLELLEYGVFGTRVKNLAPGKKLISQGHVAIERTRRIPGEHGIRFGLRFKMSPDFYDDEGSIVRLLYLTPGFTNPETGKHQDKVELEWKISADSPHHDMAFEFSDPSEIAIGEWRFYVFHEDVKLVEQVFEVVEP